jgi:anti-sigma factor RsiW
MTCRDFIQFLLDYVEDRLSPEEQLRFDAHLEICPDCRTYLDTYGKTVELAKLADRGAIPADAPEDLIQAILRSRPR